MLPDLNNDQLTALGFRNTEEGVSLRVFARAKEIAKEMNGRDGDDEVV
jgi:hypothetical protein